MKILIVEDNTANRLLVTHYVERLGAEACGAADGASAVAMFREHKPDIVLLDVILPETTPGGALFIAERVRHAVREQAILHEDSPLARVTLSLGVASIVPDAEQSPNELIALADQALYGAKHAGRDRVGRAEAPTVAA